MAATVATDPQHVATTAPEALGDNTPDGPIRLEEALVKLVEVLPDLQRAVSEQNALLDSLRGALARQADERPRVEPLTYRLEDLADALGVSRRFLERERAAGRFPKPDLRLGKAVLWRVETIRGWLERGGRS